MSTKAIILLKRSTDKLHKKGTNHCIGISVVLLAGGPERMEFNPTNKPASSGHCLEPPLAGLSSKQTDDDFD